MGRPLVWVTIAFAAGILLADRHPLDPALLLLAAGAVYAAWVLSLAVLPAIGRPRALWPGVLAIAPVLAISMALGHLTAALDPVRREVAEAARWEGRRVALEGLVAAPVDARDGRQRVILRLLRLEGAPPPRPFTVMTLLSGAPSLRYGDVVAVRGTVALPPEGGNPGEPSLRAALARRGIAALLRVPPYGSVTVVRRGQGNPLIAWALRLRDRLVSPLLTLPAPYGGVLAGLLFGTQAGVGPEMEDVFLRAGLLHVLVVSGAQVGLLAASTIALLTMLRARAAVRVLLAAAVILLFGTMVGWGAAVGRAATMALVGWGAVWSGREPDAPSTLALAALLWLAVHPASLFGLGFQLSFAATWGLVALSPVLTPPLRPRWFAQVVGATVGAQLAVLPLLAAVFQRVSLAAFPANLFVLPIVAVLVPAGFILSLIAPVLPGLAAFLAAAFLPPVWAIVALARVFAAAPGAQVWLPPVAWWQAAAAYALLMALPEMRRRAAAIARAGVRWAGAAALVLAWIAVFAGGAALPGGIGRPHLLVVVLDVGQGDAILLRGPTGRTMLVDGGGDVEIPGRDQPGEEGNGVTRDRADIGARRVVPALRRLGVRRVEVVLLSHAHEDHVGGLPAVLQNFSVDLVLDPGVPHPSPSYVRFLDLVRQRRLVYALARRGQRIDLGGGAAVRVVWPPDEERVTLEDAVNARSVVGRVEFGRISVLLTGDIEAETEQALARLEGGLASTVLKVAHHGSRTSSAPLFLDAVRPAVAVISVGRGNLFGHPHGQTLRALEQRGVRIYRTDRDGAVILRTDGAGLSVNTARPAVAAEAR